MKNLKLWKLIRAAMLSLALAASPAVAWDQKSAGGVVAGVGGVAAILGFVLASEQQDEADDCRRINASGGGFDCTNQSDLDDRVDTFETVGVIGLVGVGVGGVMYFTADTPGLEGFNSVMDRHINSIHYTSDKENLMKFSYHSPDVSGLVLSYSGSKGVGLSKEWAF